jgi:hypothetical protein
LKEDLTSREMAVFSQGQFFERSNGRHLLVFLLLESEGEEEPQKNLSQHHIYDTFKSHQEVTEILTQVYLFVCF